MGIVNDIKINKIFLIEGLFRKLPVLFSPTEKASCAVRVAIRKKNPFCVNKKAIPSIVPDIMIKRFDLFKKYPFTKQYRLTSHSNSANGSGPI